MTEIRKQDREEYRRLLDEIASDYCPAGKYCIFKEFLISAHPSRRLLVQLLAVDRFKLERSSKEGKDIGWDQALQLWVSEGMAEHFAEVYADDKGPREIYRDTMRRQTC